MNGESFISVMSTSSCRRLCHFQIYLEKLRKGIHSEKYKNVILFKHYLIARKGAAGSG